MDPKERCKGHLTLCRFEQRDALNLWIKEIGYGVLGRMCAVRKCVVIVLTEVYVTAHW